MESSDIGEILGCQFQFQEPWRKLQDRTTDLPNVPGVYVIRTENRKPVGRLRGKSDIVYIGQTRNIKSRVGSHKRVGSNPAAVSMHLDIIAPEVGALGFAYSVCKEPQEAKSAESTLLLRYFQDHLELPPVNSQTSKLNKFASALKHVGLKPDDVMRLLQERRTSRQSGTCLGTEDSG